MIHYSSPSFWSAYELLPTSVQRVADRNYKILKENPKHPSLHFKRIGRYWSVRVGMHYRALAVEIEDGLLGSGLEAMLNMTSSSSHNQALHLTAQSLRSFTASELGRYIFRTP